MTHGDDDDDELVELHNGIVAATALWISRLMRCGYSPADAKQIVRDLFEDELREQH